MSPPIVFNKLINTVIVLIKYFKDDATTFLYFTEANGEWGRDAKGAFFPK